MFSKQAVCISTAAGGGMKSANNDMAHSTFYWGVAKTYKYGAAVRATSWEQVNPGKQRAIENKLSRLADKIKRKQGHITPSIKTKVFFYIMKKLQKSGWNEADVNYWKAKGWYENKRPWK